VGIGGIAGKDQPTAPTLPISGRNRAAQLPGGSDLDEKRETMSGSAIPPPPPPPPIGATGGVPASGADNSMGTWALVLGIVSIFCCPYVAGILAIIFGVKGRQKAEQGLATNGGMATAGLVLGIIGIIVSIIASIYYATSRN
jgi:hypothetical protein